MPPLRESLESASAPVLRTIASLPRAVPFLIVLALMVAGALIPGWGWVLIALVVVLLTWILLLAWPRLTPSERLMRTAVVAIILAVAVTQAVPRG